MFREGISLPVYTLDTTDPLDDETQRCVDEVLVELTVPDGIGKHDLADFARRPGAEPQRRASEPLGQREQIRFHTLFNWLSRNSSACFSAARWRSSRAFSMSVTILARDRSKPCLRDSRSSSSGVRVGVDAAALRSSDAAI